AISTSRSTCANAQGRQARRRVGQRRMPHIQRRCLMKRIAFSMVALAALAGGVAYITPAPGQPDEKPAPIFVDKIPDGYRDWKLISVAHEEGDLNSLGAILGNDVAIKAYREGKLPYPDGTIIAALHWRHAPSEENNKIFGRPQSFVAGSPTNVQF